MKTLILALMMMLVSTTAFAQKAQVKLELDGLAPIVKVSRPSFGNLCKALSKKLGEWPETHRLRLQPKSLPPSRKHELGNIWTAGGSGLLVELNASELPEVLRAVGMEARGIAMGVCRLKDDYFYNVNDITFVTFSDDDARRLFRVLSK